MKSKHIVALFVVGVSCLLAFSHYQFSHFLSRFPGDRGEIYETWETANNSFKIKITAYYEVGIYLPGAFFVCESASVDSGEWQEFKAFRGDDAVPISRLNERFRFVNDQTAYFYTTDDFSVTVDSGRNWSIWKPLLPQSDGNVAHWGFIEAQVEANGTGRAKLARYDEQSKDRVEIEIRTENFGKTWSVVKSYAMHNDS